MVINLPNYERQTTILNNTQTIIDNLGEGGLKKYVTTFYGDNNFTVPAGVTFVFLYGVGGGGSGAAGTDTSTVVSGNAGTTTSFGTFFSFPGGGGGQAGGAGGAPGGKAGVHGSDASTSPSGTSNLKGGSIAYYQGGNSGNNLNRNGKPGAFGCGGGGSAGANYIAACGGSAHFVENRQTSVSPGSVIPITIGKGGASVSSNGVTSGAGGDGYLQVEWWA